MKELTKKESDNIDKQIDKIFKKAKRLFKQGKRIKIDRVPHIF